MLPKHSDGGDYSQRLDEHGPDELAQLAQTINSFGERLEKIPRDRCDQTTSELKASLQALEHNHAELAATYRQMLETHRIKSELLANMSHELRTPLHGVIGFCQLLGRSRLDCRQREWLGHIETASSSLLSLIKDSLDFSKVETGNLELESAPLDMAALVDETLLLQAPLAQQKNLHLLGLVYDDVPSPLMGDPMRIKQILTNLVHNAIKFTPQGDVIVQVTLGESQEHYARLDIRVKDTGIGFSDRLKRQLFEPFKQGENHSCLYGGTGLGLAISKQLAEQMGGTIEAHSEPGEGSVFNLTLPLERAAGTQPVDAVGELQLTGAPLIALYESHDPTRCALGHQIRRWGGQVIDIDAQHDYSDLTPEPDLLCIAIDRADLTTTMLDRWNDYLACPPCPVLLLANFSPFDLSNLNLPADSDIVYKPTTRAHLADALSRLLENSADVSATPAMRGTADWRPARPRVLVVDDIPSNRLLVRERLAQQGIEALTAANAHQALALARDTHVELVLMDINMPGMNGIQATRALRSLGGPWASCPYVALTAHVLPGEAQRLRDQGMQEVLSKPIDERELARILAAYLGISTHITEMAASTPCAEARLPVVDMSLGRDRAGGNLALAQDSLEMLLASLDASEAHLRQAQAEENLEALLDAAHHLNGACRCCGVPQLALVVDKLESCLRRRQAESVVEQLDEVFAAIQRLRDWRDAHRQPRALEEP